MHNSDVNLENSRSTKPLRPGGHPGFGQVVSAAAREEEPQGVEGMKIAQTAVQSIGMSTKDPWGPPIGHPQYALAVSRIFTKATNQTNILNTPPDHVRSTSILWSNLAHDKRFEQVSMSEAAPGDIIIASHPSQADGYAGIVVGNGRIVSNSSQGVQDNSSLAEIQRSHPEMAAFRYVGFRNYYRSKPLANAGYNDDEPRIPAGGPGGGQWTGSGGGTKARQSVYRMRRKSGRCGGGSEETEPESREELEREARLENFRELTPEEQAYRENEAKTEETAKQVIKDAQAEARVPKPAQKPQSFFDQLRQYFGWDAEAQQKKENDPETSQQRQTEGGGDENKVHGNSKGSTKAQHVYEIRDQSGNLVKVGISGQPLNQNGTSPRANQQTNGTESAPKVVEQIPEGPGARQEALNREQQRVNKHASQNDGQGPPLNIRPKPTIQNPSQPTNETKNINK